MRSGCSGAAVGAGAAHAGSVVRTPPAKNIQTHLFKKKDFSTAHWIEASAMSGRKGFAKGNAHGRWSRQDVTPSGDGEGSSAGASISPANGSAAGTQPEHAGEQGGGHSSLSIGKKSIGIQTLQVMMR
jgi:hypothetical protein